jgi:hypothetical protein
MRTFVTANRKYLIKQFVKSRAIPRRPDKQDLKSQLKKVMAQT